MRFAVSGTDPGFNRVIPPGRTKRLLITEQTADTLNESLYFSFNWVLMLMAWGRRLHQDPMALTQRRHCSSVAFGRARITPDSAYSVPM